MDQRVCCLRSGRILIGIDIIRCRFSMVCTQPLAVYIVTGEAPLLEVLDTNWHRHD
uniref:Uncharacterized protein n=1 Tax=Arundo donax TaxID=35708 RepID=A0A0A9A2Q9_ARUDO